MMMTHAPSVQPMFVTTLHSKVNRILMNKRNRLSWAATLFLVITLADISSTSASVDEGLVGYWPFNGNGADASDHQRDAQLVGSPTFYDGIVGDSLDLDGTGNQFAQLSADDDAFDFAARPFTIQVWALFDVLNREQVLLEDFAGSNGQGWSLTKLSNGESQWLLHTDPTFQAVKSAPSPLSVNQWYHIVASRDSTGTFFLHVNNELVAQAASTTAISDNSMPLLFGKRNTGDGRNFALDGLLDEVAVWDRALTNQEIQDLYNEGDGRAILDLQEPVPGDTDGDGDVDLVDLNNVRNHFGEVGENIPGDADGNGQVTLVDLNLVRNNFGTVAGAAAVPEPGTFGLAILLVAGAVCRGRRIIAGALSLALLPMACDTARAIEFQFLGEYPTGQVHTVPNSVTNSGAYVVGNARVNSQWTTFAWNKSQGIGPPTLCGLPSGTSVVNADASHFAGVGTHFGEPEGFVWSASGGQTWLGKLPGTELTQVTDVSMTGEVVIGHSMIGGSFRPTIWQHGAGLRLLNIGTNVVGAALGLSGDGRFIAGKVDLERQRAARWTTPTDFEVVPDLPNTGDSWASDVSDDGNRVVGYMHAENRNQAFLWDVGVGTRSLFVGQDSNSWGFARAISGDGELVGGKMDEGVNFASAFIWSEATGTQRLHDLVVAAGYELGDWHLEEVFDISRNGRFVTGVARGPTGFQAFLVDLAPHVQGDTDADGDVDLDDLNNVRNTFGQSGDTMGDANDDGVVDLDDLNAVRNNFGTTAEAAIVPEADGLSLIVLGCAMVCIWGISRRTSLASFTDAN
jgi:uncharacterized membrane protein